MKESTVIEVNSSAHFTRNPNKHKRSIVCEVNTLMHTPQLMIQHTPVGNFHHCLLLYCLLLLDKGLYPEHLQMCSLIKISIIYNLLCILIFFYMCCVIKISILCNLLCIKNNNNLFQTLCVIQLKLACFATFCVFLFQTLCVIQLKLACFATFCVFLSYFRHYVPSN